jgi:hypothetical protein
VIYTWLFRFSIVFLALFVINLLLMNVFHVSFGEENFFLHHGVFFLIAIAIFPRLTLLLSSVASGGLLWWLGWLFFPRVLVASLATLAYFKTNPILVVISWLVALSGEVFEKYGLRKKVFIYRGQGNPFYFKKDFQFKSSRKEVNTNSGDNIIEAEFTKK